MARDIYRGLIRYKGPARIVILALENLYPNGLSFILDYRLIDKFGGLDSLYPLYRCYSRSISLLARHLESTSYDITRSPVRGRRRKRESRGSEDVYPRKRVLV
ncbi:hypothetical protein N7475_000012 [Penicillium sp. IBT 31633x]|nr:hypothetical protein N7475_000012 [Penicillium sp. IBT 31633x]